MALDTTIGDADGWYVGEDKLLSFTIYTSTAKTAAKDITGWALSWKLRRKKPDADPALLTKATGGSGITITGTFNADPALNTQRAVVTIADTDTDGLGAGSYWHELKRTDAGSETVLAQGIAVLKQPVHRT